MNKKKKVIYIKNSFLYNIYSRFKMWYELKRNKIAYDVIRGIEKDEWVKNITKKYLWNVNFLYRRTHGLKTVYGEIDQSTYKKYLTLCNEYDEKCNEQLKKINPILKLIFNIKSNHDSNHLKKFLNSGKLIVVKGLSKPTLRVIAKGNNYRYHIKEKSNAKDMGTIAVSICDEVDDDIIHDLEVNG